MAQEVDGRKTFAEAMEVLRKMEQQFMAITTHPVNHELWVPWNEAVEWWGDPTDLAEYLLKYGWRAEVHASGWRAGIEPIFWETIKAKCVGQF